MQRLNQLNNQFNQNKTLISTETITVDSQTYPEVIDHNPSKPIKINFFKLNGWGYRDSGFKYDREAGAVKVLGNRYMFGGKHLPEFANFFKREMAVDVNTEDPPQEDIHIDPPILNHDFIEELG